LVLVQKQAEVGKAIASELPAIATIGNLRQQRIVQFLDLKNLAPRTRKTCARQLGWFSDWIDKDWQTVNLNNVRRYKLYLEKERKLKPNSIALALSSLKSYYTWFKLAGYVIENPMTAVSVLRPAEAEGKNLEGFQVDKLV
jgi:site-specific recombinase XerD